MSERIDKALVQRGLTQTRSQSQVLIEKGVIFCNGVNVSKASTKVRDEDKLEVQGETYVSRGAYKLITALDAFKIEVQGKVFADIGASTGGFSQALLERGASKIYCIDVGHDQLHSELKNSPQIINLEGTHINEVEIEEKVDFCVVDLSFISILKVIDKIMSLLKNQGSALILIKPQFEAGKENMGKKAVLKPDISEKVFHEVCEKLIEKNYRIKQQTISPIKGKEGNTEYLIELCSAD